MSGARLRSGCAASLAEFAACALAATLATAGIIFAIRMTWDVAPTPAADLIIGALCFLLLWGLRARLMRLLRF